MSAAPCLEAREITVRRGGQRILDGITTGFSPGSWTAIVGPNGAGKSTLLATLAGILTPAEGTVHLKDRRLTEWSLRERARALTWLGHTSHADGDLAAHEIVRLGRLPHYGLLGTPSREDETAAWDALAETEATLYAHRRLRELSGGERQRVLLARAFAAQTSLLLLDEPTVHLDAPHQGRLITSLKARSARGQCVVSVLHDLTLALGADRVLVLADGVIQADGPPTERTLQTSLIEVFEHSFAIEAIGSGTRSRLVAVPVA
jgi:iron complex transport system ATP-binding protein